MRSDETVIAPDRTLDAYNERYREAFSQPYIRELMSRIPTYMTLDDHEIEDAWPANATPKDYVVKYPAAHTRLPNLSKQPQPAAADGQ